MSPMRALSLTEISRMQAVADSSMMDTCKIGAAGTVVGGEPASRVPVDPDDYGSEISCGVSTAPQTEPGDGSQVPLSTVTIRVPVGTAVARGDRLQVTKRDGTALGTAEIYSILGVGARGRTAKILNCELVTGETTR